MQETDAVKYFMKMFAKNLAKSFDDLNKLQLANNCNATKRPVIFFIIFIF
jgi:hypothetical protein